MLYEGELCVSIMAETVEEGSCTRTEVCDYLVIKTLNNIAGNISLPSLITQYLHHVNVEV